jgi:hypothetical protein
MSVPELSMSGFDRVMTVFDSFRLFQELSGSDCSETVMERLETTRNKWAFGTDNETVRNGEYSGTLDL